MCGENGGNEAKELIKEGSPPRVRGKRQRVMDAHEHTGITPACAGKTRKGEGNQQRS